MKGCTLLSAAVRPRIPWCHTQLLSRGKRSASSPCEPQLGFFVQFLSAALRANDGFLFRDTVNSISAAHRKVTKASAS